MYFHVVWPGNTPTCCYGFSLVVQDYLQVGQSYPLDDFLQRCRHALHIASERVRAKYGFACSQAMDQLADIEQLAAPFQTQADAQVLVTAFS